MNHNTKYVDLHKVASLLRDIQTAGYSESEVAHQEAIEEDNAFNTAAAKAAIAGQSEFEFNGKKYPCKMSKEEAQKLLDSQANDEEPVVEEPKAEEDNAEEVLTKGMEDEMADKIEDKLEDEESNEEAVESPEAPVEEAPVEEAPEETVEADVELTTDALKTILDLAGVRPVTVADINQPEAVEEYSNSPDEQYGDVDTQLNKMSGGVNGPKAMPTVGNDGHNRLVMKLKKAYDDME